ncbi:UDP-N-acetylglucosamine 2-epimerase (non-hydrolyzing) [Methanospirillum sp. J.3.6.1-F.2.7.3]|uniref:UDP-N-acetylglucosamine 2-epimerase (Non-hydrolyzing) n=1 Tax=Methanospirillum purgamenti TaxID=2834276 RepID=A0A8E7AWG2_9EURY|nr:MULTISPECIES: UDP-N-acetylglucosamine 2-epimerase (non-hydrolyzing) [Methanospirillum]MDX8548938.1 UDP-N-acetylglucosamine 2-epimerase (non-hydrolyzing) [Methanospirillum hungatei]QVV88625.1 UDP-N-acetylglucosamine 2-epimerase (non-hydrolyzing) [Methanospirillum sp. J.3.6.1-F.2.7.3]
MTIILSIVGARPQFIKCAPLSKKIREWCTEILVHTGQHYDENMSDVFFSELGISHPDYNLQVGSGPHGEQTGKMLAEIEKILLEKKPDMVLVYGDTNSTIAGSLAASKLHIPIAHVEAGLRSYDRRMPEEINRVLTDHVSDLLFCPTQTAVLNLEKEGVTKGVFITGDVMVDAIFQALPIARKMSNILADIRVSANEYYLATVHRPSNTDDKYNLLSILQAFSELAYPVVFPIHPRTRKSIENYRISLSAYPNIIFTDPLPYVDMVRLLIDSRLVLTDSGGLQKEAYILKKPCVTLRDTTEWIETVEEGWNILAGADNVKIINEVSTLDGYSGVHRQCYGDGTAADNIIKIIKSYFKK